MESKPGNRRSRSPASELASLDSHRDGLVVGVEGWQAPAPVSQGQQRTAVISIKLAEGDCGEQQIPEELSDQGGRPPAGPGEVPKSLDPGTGVLELKEDRYPSHLLQPTPVDPKSRALWARELARIALAGGLLVVMAGLIVLGFVSAWNGRGGAAVDDLLKTAFPSVAALLAAAIAFYYATEKDR